MTIWDCRTHVHMTSMTSSVERTDLDFKISVALLEMYKVMMPSVTECFLLKLFQIFRVFFFIVLRFYSPVNTR